MKLASATLASAALIAVPAASLASGNLFQGNITWFGQNQPVVATEQWATPFTTLSWNISYSASNPFHWNYEYKWSTADKNLSHLILEVSPLSVAGDFSGLPPLSEAPKLYSPSNPEGSSNPSLPGDIFGIKFGSKDLTSVTISFDSTHAPTWGDFYAKDGKNQGRDVLAFNSGFTTVDPTIDFGQIKQGIYPTLMHDGERANHIAVPDTINRPYTDFTEAAAPVPEASVGWGFAGIATAAAFSVVRNRQKRKQVS